MAKSKGDTIEVVRKCSVCGEEIDRFEETKENLFLTSRGTVHCAVCQMETPELRDVAKRLEARQKELATLPPANS